VEEAVRRGKAGFNPRTYNMTNAELHYISINSDILIKTKFYKNGEEITGVELDKLKKRLKGGGKL
jgi:hypothetical protein